VKFKSRDNYLGFFVAGISAKTSVLVGAPLIFSQGAYKKVAFIKAVPDAVTVVTCGEKK
jgi:uncharacterized membrane protein